MSIEEENKAVMRRWYEEVYNQRHLALMPELAGPEYIRHEPTGTWTATIAEHLERVKQLYGAGKHVAKPRSTYELIAEATKLPVMQPCVAIGVVVRLVRMCTKLFRYSDLKRER